jgi:hypothetical protein
MVKSFTAFGLTPDDIAPVFPLVQTVAPEIELGAWRSFAQRLVEDGPASLCGGIGLRNAAGYICGVLVFRAEHDLRHGRVLAIDLFISLDFVSTQEATGALLQIAECKARELRCAATHIRVAGPQTSLAERFLVAGHRLEASIFCKNVSAAKPPS